MLVFDFLSDLLLFVSQIWVLFTSFNGFLKTSATWLGWAVLDAYGSGSTLWNFDGISERGHGRRVSSIFSIRVLLPHHIYGLSIAVFVCRWGLKG